MESQESNANESGKSLLFFETLRAMQTQGVVPEFKFILKVEMDSLMRIENLIEKVFAMRTNLTG